MAMARMSADGSICGDGRGVPGPQDGGKAGAGADVHDIRCSAAGPLHDHLDQFGGRRWPGRVVLGCAPGTMQP